MQSSGGERSLFPIHDVTTKENTKPGYRHPKDPFNPDRTIFKERKKGSSDKCVLFFKHARLLFNQVGRGNQSPDPLSLWERARVRELLQGRTLVSARISSSGWNAFFTSGYALPGAPNRKRGKTPWSCPSRVLIRSFHAMWTSCMEEVHIHRV